MRGDYPRCQTSYAHEDLVGHFLLTPAEQSLVISRELALAGVAGEYEAALKTLPYVITVR